MGTILYNMLQYCSVLYNMKYLIVMHWFSDGAGGLVAMAAHSWAAVAMRVGSNPRLVSLPLCSGAGKE